MTSAYILVAAVLILGGIIAALGDKLGSKVGKAKLRLFNLRPRETAVVLTVITGILISASTLGILFTFSKSLREGVFKLDDILKQLRTAQSDLEKATEEKGVIEKQLQETKRKQTEVQKRSREIDDNYNRALKKLRSVSIESKKLQADVQMLLKERQQLATQKQLLLGQMSQLQAQVRLRDDELNKRQQKIAEQDRILSQGQQQLARSQELLAQRQQQLQVLAQRYQTLEAQRQQLQADINQRDTRINELDQAIARKDQDIRAREGKLKDLEGQLAYLNREVQVLEQYYQNYQELRERRIALVRGQVLAAGAVRVIDPQAVTTAVDELLRQANKVAIQATRPNNQSPPTEPIVKITKAQVEQLSQQLQQGGDVVVRIISAGNYVQGENDIRVFADVAPNKLIFREGETIATISMESSTFTEEDIQKRLDLLLSAAQFRARREGVIGNIQVEDGRIKTLINFIEEINVTDQRPDEVRVEAANETYPLGPLKLRLIALKKGEVIFRS